jgi:phosphopentomutase
MRALFLVMDSVEIGAAPDASLYGDEGADTVGHIAQACALGHADNGRREGALRIPNLVDLGEACRLATGRVPAGLGGADVSPQQIGCASEQSKGKDTPSGHWEIAGVPVPFDWGYFPRTVPYFPSDHRTPVRGSGPARHHWKPPRLRDRDHRLARRTPHAEPRTHLLHLR